MYFYILINMYRALYGHKTDLHDYLSFSAGDHFTVIRSANKDWFQVQNGLGEIGYIPQTYVKEIQVRVLQCECVHLCFCLNIYAFYKDIFIYV